MNIDIQICRSLINNFYTDYDQDRIEWEIKGFDELLGFHGSHKLLKIKFKRHGKDERKGFFVKSISEHPLIIKYYNGTRCFEKEHMMLGEIMDVLQSQVEEQLVPKCYISEINKFVVLEDLSSRGYLSCDKMLDLHHNIKTLRKLAVLHASSIILEEKSGMSISEKFPNILFETLVSDDKGFPIHGLLLVVQHFIMEKMEVIPLEHKMDLYLWAKRNLIELCKPSLKFRNVITHGDPWVRNYMYKYNDEGLIADVLLVDLQACRIVPPAQEIATFLCIRLSQEQIASNRTQFLNEYYDSFSKCLIKANLQPCKVLPLSVLQESFDYYTSYGLISSLIYRVITGLPQEYLATVDTPEKFVKLLTKGDIELSNIAFENSPPFRKRCVQGLKDLYEQYLIKTQK